MKKTLLKIGIILGVSAASSFISSTGIAILVGFFLYSVVNGHGHVLEIASGKFWLATILVWPVGLGGGIIGGLVGWLKTRDGPDSNRRIVTWSAIGGVMVALIPACFIGITSIA